MRPRPGVNIQGSRRGHGFLGGIKPPKLHCQAGKVWRERAGAEGEEGKPFSRSLGRRKALNQFTHESGTERQGAIRNRVEPSQAHGGFRPVRRRSYPRGFRLLLRRPERSRGFRRANPAKRPRSQHEQGAQGSRDGGERADLAKSVKPPRWSGVTNHVAPLQKRKQP
jgi:hypothetical protein